MDRSLTAKQVKPKKMPLSPTQKIFQSRKKKIEQLRKKHKMCVEILERDLLFYQKEIFPKEKDLQEVVIQKIKLIGPYLRDKRNLSKKKRHFLSEIVLECFEEITGFFEAFDEELAEIYKQVKGVSFQEEQLEGFHEFAGQMEDLCAEAGVNVDLSGVKAEGSKEEIIRKLFESIKAQGMDPDDIKRVFSGSASEEALTGKQQQKQEVQQKEMSVVYKQLAKVFHPDLEPDPRIKLEKEALMKRLTAAYEARDLYSLLALEVEAMNISDQQKKTRTDQQLKVYSELLQSQVEVLEQELREIPLQFQYAPLTAYGHYDWRKGRDALMEIKKSLENSFEAHAASVREMQVKNPLAVIEKMLRKKVHEEKESILVLDSIFGEFQEFLDANRFR